MWTAPSRSDGFVISTDKEQGPYYTCAAALDAPALCRMLLLLCSATASYCVYFSMAIMKVPYLVAVPPL